MKTSKPFDRHALSDRKGPRHASIPTLSLGWCAFVLAACPAGGYDIYLQGEVGSIGMYGTTILDSVEVALPAANPSATWDSIYVNGTVQTIYGPKTYGAQVSGSVDLSTGTLKGFLTATGLSQAKMSVLFGDRIYPQWDSGATDPFTVTLKWNVYGDWYQDHPTKPSNHYTYTYLHTQKNVDLDYTGLPLDQPYNLEDDIAQGDGHLDRHEQTVSIPFDPAVDSFISLAAQLGLWCQPGSELKTWVADFSHTGTLQIELPAGASFTSESGVLLVPEPAVTGLLAVGVMILLRGTWRRSPKDRRP